MMTPGRTVTAEKLLLHLWGRATARERRTLKQLIYRLRHKLESDASAPEVLQTTPGAGYKLVGRLDRLAISSCRITVMRRTHYGAQARNLTGVSPSFD